MDTLNQLPNLVAGSLQTCSILMTCCEPDGLGQKMITSSRLQEVTIVSNSIHNLNKKITRSNRSIRSKLVNLSVLYRSDFYCGDLGENENDERFKNHINI